MDRPTHHDFDRDGAIAELEHEAREAPADGRHSRAAFLMRGGALLGGGLALGSLPVALAGARSGPSASDVKILNYALTLEYLEAAFYAEAQEKGKLSGETALFAKVAGGDEQAHVDALKTALGSRAVKAPKFDFKGTTASMKTFLKTAMTLENVGVSAYQGQAPRIDSSKILAAAGSILAVEARHAAWVTDIIGGGKGPLPAPSAFNKAMSMSAVLGAVKGTGFITT